MDKILEEVLRPVINGYSELREKGGLRAPVPQDQRALCVKMITAHMERLDRDDPAYRESAFLRNALRSGWLVSDLDALSAFWRAVPQAPERDRAEGDFLLRQIASLRMDKLIDRFETMKRVNNYLYTTKYKDKNNAALQDANTKVAALQHTPVFPAEYPNDPDFAETAGTKDLDNGVRYLDISNDTKRFIGYQRAADARRRSMETYVFQESGGEGTEAERPFETSLGHRLFGGITKHASTAIREAFGNEVYDEIREMGRGELGDRKVPLNHSLGTKYQKLGHDVLEMEFAGSSAEDVYKAHKERIGKIDLAGKSDQKIREIYGEQVEKPGGKGKFDFIWKKERTIELPNNQTAKKLRYTFAGVSPTMFGGTFNLGAYSIESSRDNARNFAKAFLEERFNDWLQHPEHRKPIHINLSGHSRGSVTAGLAALKIDEWVTEYIKTHQGAEQFKDLLYYDLILRDPVAGLGTDLRLGSCDLRKIPNLNVTVLASMGVQAADKILPLQYVQGVRKLVLTTTDHLMDITGTDDSQKMLLGNDKTGHMVSYYDSETGEMHRGSGLSELPDGIYVADEKCRLVRMTSYSQVNELFKSVFDKSSSQATRTQRIHKMVRDWFCENELQMSFPDERTRRMEEAKNDCTQNKLLQIKSKRMFPIQAEIEKLDLLKRKNHSREALIAQNKKLIEACRTYMKETGMPPSGNSAYKLGLVGDTLSYTMRENNQLTKELSLARGENRVFPLDEKIKAYRERMEKKPGYLERKQTLEAQRLGQEKGLLDLIGKTAKQCRDSLDILDNTRVGKQGSASYEKLHKILEAGTRLDAQVSVTEMTEFLKRFTKLSADYSRSHDSLIGPITTDGQRRLLESQTLSSFGKTAAEDLKKLSADLGEKNTSIGLRITERSANLEYLKKRQEELKGPGTQAAVDPEKQPAVHPASHALPV